MAAPEVAAHLRSRKPQICETWRAAVERDLPELGSLSRAALIDHLPEVIDALARWAEGDTRAARLGFEALADGHAVQRLGYGIDLRTLTREYRHLRTVILSEVLSIDASAADVMRINDGLDEALYESVRRYAESRDAIRDRFIDILAHDLRNPLNAVTVAASSLQLGARAPEDLATVGRVIATSASRMQRLIDDLLELARNQLGSELAVVLVAADMAEMANAAVRELATAHPHRALALETSGTLTGQFDRERVIQALSNLIANAIEHGADPIEISVRETVDRRAIVTSVASRGVTLSTDELQALLDPMRATRGNTRGLGLGLRIVGSIALAHGATVTTSATDGITRVVVTWPRANSEELPADPRA